MSTKNTVEFSLNDTTSHEQLCELNLFLHSLINDKEFILTPAVTKSIQDSNSRFWTPAIRAISANYSNIFPTD